MNLWPFDDQKNSQGDHERKQNSADHQDHRCAESSSEPDEELHDAFAPAERDDLLARFKLCRGSMEFPGEAADECREDGRRLEDAQQARVDGRFRNRPPCGMGDLSGNHETLREAYLERTFRSRLF